MRKHPFEPQRLQAPDTSNNTIESTFDCSLRMTLPFCMNSASELILFACVMCDTVLAGTIRAQI